MKSRSSASPVQYRAACSEGVVMVPM
jgi:hypothetical protein